MYMGVSLNEYCTVIFQVSPLIVAYSHEFDNTNYSQKHNNYNKQRTVLRL